MPLIAAVDGLDPGLLGQGSHDADLTVVRRDGLGPDQEPDVLVVAAATARDLARVQSAHRDHPGVAIVLVVHGSDPHAVRRALAYTPRIPADVETVTDEVPGEVGRRAVAAARRTVAARRHRTVVTRLAEQPEQPPPQLRPSGDSLATVLDHAPLGVVVAGLDGRLLRWNARAAGMLLLAPADVGRPLPELFEDGGAVVDAVALSGTGETFSHAVATRAARSEVAVEVNAAGTELSDGRRAVLVLLVDVTVRAAAEAARDELDSSLRLARRSQQLMLHATDVLVGATGYRETLEGLARVAVPAIAELCLVDVVENGRLTRVVARHADPALQPLTDELLARYAPRPHGDHPAALALRDGQTRWAGEIGDDFLRRTSRDERHYDIVRRLAFSSYISVPLRTAEGTLGIMTLVACGEHRFGPDDVALAEDLAGRVAIVVAKARRYDREHELAEALQRSMLPEDPQLPGFEVATAYVPAGGDARVGGDWYDGFALPGEDPVVVIGDVVGHDLGAATCMGQLRNAVRALAWGRSGRPAEVLAALDAVNRGLGITELATVVVGSLRRTGDGARLVWSNAGHPAPLLVTSDGSARFLDDVRDPLLGAPDAAARHEGTVDLPPGSTVLLYTDGLVERRTDQLESGPGALASAASAVATLPVTQMCAAVLGELAASPGDDVALLAVRVP